MNTSNDFRKTLNIVRDQIFDSIRSLMEQLGGKVCFSMYHEFDIIDLIIDLRYTFFEVDGDGYGRELFLHTAVQTPAGDIDIMLHDTEDCYESMWNLEDMTATDALYMLEELEQIADFHTEHPDKPVLTEYDADFDWENY
jgi:hypothetical protein